MTKQIENRYPDKVGHFLVCQHPPEKNQIYTLRERFFDGKAWKYNKKSRPCPKSDIYLAQLNKDGSFKEIHCGL